MTTKLKQVLATLCAVAWAGVLPAAYAQSSEILETSILEDEFGSAGWLGLKVKVPSENLVTVYASPDMETWTAATEPVITLQEQIDLQVQMRDQVAHQFYRVETKPIPLSVQVLRDG